MEVIASVWHFCFLNLALLYSNSDHLTHKSGCANGRSVLGADRDMLDMLIYDRDVFDAGRSDLCAI